MISFGSGFWWSTHLEYNPNAKAGVTESIQKKVETELRDRLENPGKYKNETPAVVVPSTDQSSELSDTLCQSEEFGAIGTALIYGNGNGNKWFSEMSESDQLAFARTADEIFSAFDGLSSSNSLIEQNAIAAAWGLTLAKIKIYNRTTGGANVDKLYELADHVIKNASWTTTVINIDGTSKFDDVVSKFANIGDITEPVQFQDNYNQAMKWLSNLSETSATKHGGEQHNALDQSQSGIPVSNNVNSYKYYNKEYTDYVNPLTNKWNKYMEYMAHTNTSTHVDALSYVRPRVNTRTTSDHALDVNPKNKNSHSIISYHKTGGGVQITKNPFENTINSDFFDSLNRLILSKSAKDASDALNSFSEFVFSHRLQNNAEVERKTDPSAENEVKSAFICENADFIVDAGATYKALITEIASNYASHVERKAEYNLLDKAFDDYIELCADQLSKKIAQFFNAGVHLAQSNGSDKTYHRLLDQDFLKEQLIALAAYSKEASLNSGLLIDKDKSLEDNIQLYSIQLQHENTNIQTAQTNLAYYDFKALSEAINGLKQLPLNHSNEIANMDNKLFKETLEQWFSSLGEILAEYEVSVVTKKLVFNTLEKSGKSLEQTTDSASENTKLIQTIKDFFAESNAIDDTQTIDNRQTIDNTLILELFADITERNDFDLQSIEKLLADAFYKELKNSGVKEEDAAELYWLYDQYQKRLRQISATDDTYKVLLISMHTALFSTAFVAQ